MKQCSLDSATKLTPPFESATGQSCAAWPRRRAGVIQLTHYRMSEAVYSCLIKSSFNGGTIGSLPDAVQEIDASSVGCSLFYKWIRDLCAPAMARCAQLDHCPK
jgi:hypothetical protein